MPAVAVKSKDMSLYLPFILSATKIASDCTGKMLAAKNEVIKRPIKAVASNFDVTWKGGVDTLDEFYRGSCTHGSHVDNYNTSS